MTRKAKTEAAGEVAVEVAGEVAGEAVEVLPAPPGAGCWIWDAAGRCWLPDVAADSGPANAPSDA